MSSEITSKVPKGVYQIISDMVKDILITFPEEKESLNSDLHYIINNPPTTDEDVGNKSIVTIYEFCKLAYPPHFLHIMYQNEELFNSELVELLPGMNFSLMWKLNISNTTKETLWKYLQLVLFNTISGDLDGALNSNMFKDSSELNSKMTDLLSNVQEYISKQSKTDDTNTNTNTDKQDSPIDSSSNPIDSDNGEKIDMNKLLGGKLGEMAREIASESAELFSSEQGESVGDALKNMLKNPSKVMDMFKHVGDKLESNIKSGKISETDMLMEASNVLKSLTNIPGFSSNGLMDMMKTMGGMGGLGGMGGMGGLGGLGGMNPLNGLDSLFASNTVDPSQPKPAPQTNPKNKHRRQLTVHERLQKKMLERNKE